MQLTKQQKYEEIVKCNQSPIYYLNTHGKVYHPKRGHIKLTLYKYQEEIIEAYVNNRFNITLKSRQTGLSTITAGYVAWLLQFHQAKEVVIIANKKQVAQNFIRKVKTFINATPSWLRCTITTNNKTNIELSNGSRLGAYATTSDAARSESLSLLIIDEAAIIDSKKVEDLWASVYPTLFIGGSAILISTPKGVGNFFHKQWEAATSKASDFYPIYVHWTRHPEYAKDLEYDEKGKPTSVWYRDQCTQFLFDQRKIAQELDCEFLASGEMVVDADALRDIAQTLRSPIRIGGVDHEIHYYEDPIPDEAYLITGDVCRGDGTDYSAFHVYKLSTCEEVCDYRGKMPADYFGDLLMSVGREYNLALIACEANNHGWATCLSMERANYPNLFYSTASMFKTTSKEEIRRIMEEKKIPGFQTTPATRPLLIVALEEGARQQHLIIRGVRTYNELKTFIWHNGRAEAIKGCNDDMVMSHGIACLLLKTYLSEYRNAKVMRQKMIEGITTSSVESSKHIPVLHAAHANRNTNPWEFVGPTGDIEDLTWLLVK